MMFNKLRRARPAGPARTPPIIVVSGLPRSGTSMMMKMLSEGGLEVVTDAIRAADEDNPNGYFEFEPVKRLADGQDEWLKDARGKLVKVISALLEHLPATYDYRVVFMEREIKEILVSQQKMLRRRSEASKTTDVKLETQFREHLRATKYWLARQPNMSVMYVDYNRLMADPDAHCGPVADFLAVPLDLSRMRRVPNEGLYRNRAPRT
ncbi:MAG: sulfotransferase domain-containing protein [Chloroflexota bacterium]